MPSEGDPVHRQYSESVAFRLPAGLKAELNRLAERNHQSLGELMRDFARQRLALERRRTFRSEARRQAQEAAAVAEDPTADEYAIMQELGAELDELDNEWR
ncbi:MAG: ribbon-helix-helix protein, CopG family [Gammaproteobacteria bacterium]|nr:ribbon-helix-helix protein, CopG family [Gammaproteobacteria bacterium]